MRPCALLFIFSLIFCVRNCISNELILTNLINENKIQEAIDASKVDASNFNAGCNTNSYSGYFTVNDEYNSNLFFWFFKHEVRKTLLNYNSELFYLYIKKNGKAPIILWLNGGPGVSSLLGLFNLNGPFSITDDLTVKCRDDTWTKDFSVLYIDSPVGTGFSFTNDDQNGYAKNLDDYSVLVYEALKQFFKLFPDLNSNDFYVMGESYAGKYVPGVAEKIHSQKDTDEGIKNLKGIAIGNGWIDPVSMVGYGDLLYEFGLIDEIQKKDVDEKTAEISDLIKNDKYPEALGKADKLLSKSRTQQSLFDNYTGYSFYSDLRLSVNPHNFKKTQQLLDKQDYKTALHVGERAFILGSDSNPKVFKPMALDFPKSAKPQLTTVMNNYKVLLYGGQFDIGCAPRISYAFLKDLEWNNKAEYATSTQQVWKLDAASSDVAGYVGNAGDFYEVVVRNAGHYVPADQPKAALDLITKFIKNEL